MIVRRRIVLLLIEELVEGGLLLGAALQDQQHALHGQARGRRALVIFRERERMRVAAQYDEVRFIDRLSDPRRGVWRLRGGLNRARKNEDENTAETRKGWAFPGHMAP